MEETMSQDEPYRLYLARFQSAVGELEAGAYGKSQGRLVKKLTPAEFEPLWADFVELRAAYENMLAGGFTVDNAILKVLRERAAELVVELPQEMK
jgi:hypothetical protein